MIWLQATYFIFEKITVKPCMIKVGERFRDYLSEVCQQCNELEMKDLSERFTVDVVGKEIFHQSFVSIGWLIEHNDNDNDIWTL